MPDKLQAAIDKIDEAIKAARELGRSREASIAITHLETAELWLCKLWGDQDE